jgi:hypothetical protein
MIPAVSLVNTALVEVGQWDDLKPPLGAPAASIEGRYG